MPAKITVAGKELKGAYSKGDVIALVPDGGDWGAREVPPNFVRLTISDATIEEAYQYISGWKLKFVFTLVNENAQGWRYRVEVDPTVISASEVGKSELKSDMQSLIDNAAADSIWDGCQTVSFFSNGWAVDIPKNGTYQTATGATNQEYLKALRDDVVDKFTAAVRLSRYYFAEADVELALTKFNGEVTITKAQALSKIKDKLED